MSESVALLPSRSYSGATTTYQPRRHSHKALAARYPTIGPTNALALFAFEDALNACDITPYGLPHEWHSSDMAIAHIDDWQCLGALECDHALLVSRAYHAYRGATAAGQTKHLLFGLEHVNDNSVDIVYSIVETVAPSGDVLVRPTPKDIARLYPTLTPLELIAVADFFALWGNDDIFLARNMSDVPYRMGIDLNVLSPEEIALRVKSHLWALRDRIENALDCHSRVVVALCKSISRTSLWYGVVGVDGDNNVINQTTVTSRVGADVVGRPESPAIKQLPAPVCGARQSATPGGVNSAHPLVVDRQEPQDCVAVLGLYPEIAPSALAIVFEIDRALDGVPHRWQSASEASTRITDKARETAWAPIEYVTNRLAIEKTGAAIRSAVSRCVAMRSGLPVAAVLWARPSGDDESVVIACEIALVRVAIDSDAIVAAVNNTATSVGATTVTKGGEDDYGDMPHLIPIHQDVFDLVKLYPWLTSLQTAALSRLVGHFDAHEIPCAWMAGPAPACDCEQRLAADRWVVDCAAKRVVDAYSAATDARSMEIALAPARDGGMVCRCTFVA